MDFITTYAVLLRRLMNIRANSLKFYKQELVVNIISVVQIYLYLYTQQYTKCKLGSDWVLVVQRATINF